MDERQLQQLIINMSALHQELQKQSAEALSLQAQGIRRLEEGLSEVNRLVADEVSNQMAAVSGDLRRNIKKGSQEGLDDLRAEIDDVKKHMEDFAGFSAVAPKSFGCRQPFGIVENRVPCRCCIGLRYRCFPMAGLVLRTGCP